ncbi:hypothetical protein AK812_SmicGene43686 [Symbiodinium microadriaticum]|uniref:Uncharacterized protein n=1 Tax=Symbiodinium microadriaticum TaxID=2951 RepID=A0A1Q9C0E1_SYMMI|nr:hypothetical protein AK812_SmicGene43686 [Symbiodinium microadriaticum]
MSECPHHASASRGFVDESEVDWDDSHSSASQPDVEPFGSSEASPNIMSERNQRDMSSRPGDFESWLSDLAIDPAVPHSEAPASHKVQSVASETQHSSLKPGGFANVLREAHLSLQDSTPKNFWEQGFWSDFFGSASMPDAILPKFKDRRPEPYQITTCEPSGSIPTSQAKKPRLEFTAVFQKVVINRQLISWRDARESSFEVAILKWIALFGSWESSRDEALDVFSQRTEQMQRTIISDCIARKAPSTALKRAKSMLKFTKLATQASLSMPVGEADTYGILHDAKAGGAPLSQLRGFMESITFVRHVFDIKSLDETCVSKRCWGVTVARVATPVRQADPLRVKDLRELHRVLKEDPCAWNRCFAGSGLFCAYGRCRWSDMQHLDGLTIEHENGPRTPLSFVGGILDVHKTMNLQGPQPRVLEIVAPAKGITEDDWASKWIAAREEVGCDWSQGGTHPSAEIARVHVGSLGETSQIMSMIDSSAEFESRCRDVCGDTTLLDLERLKAAGIGSFPSLAFACGTPQTPPTELEFASFAERVNGAGIPLGTSAQLRRLHFEAITLVVAHLKQQAIADPAEAVKKLPLAEKQARIEDQKLRLKGVLLEDEMQPSHSLIDACAHMIEQNHVTWIPPSKCTKRDQELKEGFKDRSKFLVAAEGGVTLAPAASNLTADCQTPLQLQWCLQRRGLALDLNHVISWETHERWVAFLMQSLAQEVPSGYANISVDQILKADCELFLLVSKDIKRVKVGPDGTMEADVALNKLKTHPRVTMHLLPLRSPGKATGSNQVPNDVPEFADVGPDLSW